MKEYPVEKIEVWGDTLALFTKELEMVDRDDGEWITLGCFLVEIPNSGRQQIRFFNLTQVAYRNGYSYSHPCVSQTSGQACWGGFTKVVGKLYREGNLSLLVDMVFEYLETWSEESPEIHPDDWEEYTSSLSEETRENLIADRKKRALGGLEDVLEVPESLISPEIRRIVYEQLYQQDVQVPSGLTGGTAWTGGTNMRIG